MTEERTAIVTGASSGIGAASALRLARAGVKVLVNYGGNTAGAEATVAACIDAGVDAFAMQGDVSDDATCRAIAKAAQERWGRIDILINNAGVTVSADHRELDALDATDFNRLYGVNLIGSYQMVRACLPLLQQATAASVINTSSIAGLSGMGSSIAYAASKGALNTMTMSLARSLAPEVRVNAVCPGFVDSEWWAKQTDEATIERLRARARATTPLNRVVTSDDVAEAIMLFALGGRSITGQMLTIDNGMLLNIGRPLADVHE